MVGEYLGQTAPKVKKVIEKALGGVLFIDEAYSLGNVNAKKDSYSEECLNALNQHLSEKAGQFICIIAGYKDELKKSFFTNPGLERRFRQTFSINKYTPSELAQIFNKMVIDDKWKINIKYEKLINFLENNKDFFKFYGGDMETLLLFTRDAHSKRVLGLHPKLKRILTLEDIKEGFELFKTESNRDDNKQFRQLMYSMYS